MKLVQPWEMDGPFGWVRYALGIRVAFICRSTDPEFYAVRTCETELCGERRTLAESMMLADEDLRKNGWVLT